MEHYFPECDRIRQRAQWVNTAAAGTVCGDLGTTLLEGNESTGTYLFLCHTNEKLRNVIGTFHGGSAAIVADQCMGMVANSMFQEDGHAPTSQLCVNFHRPLVAGEDLLISVQIVNASRRQIHLRCDIFRRSAPEKLCVSATSVFFRTGRE